MKNIVLIGFMGTGKSSVGRILARRMKREFVDLDRYLEQREKRKIREIFEKEGEPYFRAIEKEAVNYWSRKENLVITTGGGAMLDPENRSALKQNGYLVALLATPETLYQRLKNSKNRPLLSHHEDLRGEIAKLLEKRKPCYEKSDFYFQTDGKNASEVARLVLNVLGKKV